MPFKLLAAACMECLLVMFFLVRQEVIGCQRLPSPNHVNVIYNISNVVLFSFYSFTRRQNSNIEIKH